MKKTYIGIGILVVLIAIMIGNTLIGGKEEAEPNYIDVTGDPSVTGGMITSEDVGLEAGNAAPDFELETLDGEVIRLSDLKGEKVILNFWASWCPPCKEEMPEIQEFYDTYHDEVKIIAVNFNEKDDKVTAFLAEHGYTFPTPLDRDGSVGKDYGVITLPTTYFIGTDGIIQQPRHVGPMTFEFMEEMMNSLN